MMQTIRRREFLARSSSAVIGSTAIAGVLSACGGTSATGASNASSASPKRGGTLHAGLTGGGSVDTLNPLNIVDIVGGAYAANLFDALVTYDAAARLQLSLAREISSNRDATVWTIRLRPGVTWHDGRDLTADDVIHTFRTIVDPKNPQVGAPLVSTLVPGALKKLDNLTVEVPFSAPYSTFPQSLSQEFGFSVVPVGFDPKKPKPVGTGPFKYSSYTPGQQAVFTRNETYWQHGLPYVDTLILSDVADESTQVNGLISGQYDIVNALSSASIQTVSSGGAKVLVSDGGTYVPFTMRADRPPFSDVRVRQAFRLLVDRHQMLETVFNGNGLIGNDLYSNFDAVYNHALPQRTQDTEQAKFLFKQAGLAGQSFNLVTSAVGQGATQMAQVLAQQATAAGVTVKLQQVPVDVMYGPNYLRWEFAQDYWPYEPYFAQVAGANLPGGAYNETHWANPRFLSLYRQGLAATDTGLRTEIAHEMQSIYYNEGTYIIPIFSPTIDGYRSTVGGMVKSTLGQSFNNYDLKSIWLA